MKKIYIIITVLIVLAGGALLFFGMEKKAEAPVSENSLIDNDQADVVNTNSEEIPTSTVGAYQPPKITQNAIACTMEAKLCPDGSYVGRTGPKCEFTVCPSSIVKEFVILGKNFSFMPSLITVKKGDRVKITFKNTLGFHDFRIDEYGVATKQAQAPYEEVLEFIADRVGSFEYYCSVGTHRAMGMKGILKVE